MTRSSVSVIYLCYIPYGIRCLIDFIMSYKKFDAGLDHSLIIVFKGAGPTYTKEPFLTVLRNHNIPFQQLTYIGKELDIATYYWAAKHLQSEDLFFLNTRSKILTSNWLHNFYTASKSQLNTVFSASGSWQSHVSTAFIQNKITYDKSKSVKVNMLKYLLLIKAATLWWYNFPLFPNPHIRTNGFFINRLLFLSLKLQSIVSKRDAHQFESGRNSFTIQLKKKGYNVALLSKDGEEYSEERWAESKIFWSGNQENLIVEDNQTELYANADFQNKILLKRIVWG